jgi:cytochrome c oxidase subunit 4
VYVLTLGALLVLTAATVAFAQIDLGRWALAVALAIALTKAVVVALFFMHLRWDAPVLRAAVSLALLLMACCYGLSFLDWGFRPQPSQAGTTLQSSALAARRLR